MTGEIERLKGEEAQAALEKKRAAEALMVEVHRSNAEQVLFSSTSSENFCAQLDSDIEHQIFNCIFKKATVYSSEARVCLHYQEA